MGQQWVPICSRPPALLPFPPNPTQVSLHLLFHPTCGLCLAPLVQVQSWKQAPCWPGWEAPASPSLLSSSHGLLHTLPPMAPSAPREWSYGPGVSSGPPLGPATPFQGLVLSLMKVIASDVAAPTDLFQHFSRSIVLLWRHLYQPWVKDMYHKASMLVKYTYKPEQHSRPVAVSVFNGMELISLKASGKRLLFSLFILAVIHLIHAWGERVTQSMSQGSWIP